MQFRMPDESRMSNTRVAAERMQQVRPGLDRWKPSGMLVTPAPHGGYRFRWITEKVQGQEDSRSVSSALQEGYRPVTAEELPPDLPYAPDAEGSVRYGGLILCKIPEQFCIDREAFHRAQWEGSLKSVNTLQGVTMAPGYEVAVEDRGTRTLEGNAALSALVDRSG